jgi:hypothetical protein
MQGHSFFERNTGKDTGRAPSEEPAQRSAIRRFLEETQSADLKYVSNI